eukprot:501035-Heterocapsa_arctica.AAC.1
MRSIEKRVAMSSTLRATWILPSESCRSFRSTAMRSMKRVSLAKPDAGLTEAGGFLRRQMGHSHRNA